MSGILSRPAGKDTSKQPWKVSVHLSRKLKDSMRYREGYYLYKVRYHNDSVLNNIAVCGQLSTIISQLNS